MLEQKEFFRSPWHILWKISDVKCSDGKYRMCYVGHADTFYTLPARIKVRGKTVTGFVTKDDGVYEFHAQGKNGNLLP